MVPRPLKVLSPAVVIICRAMVGDSYPEGCSANTSLIRQDAFWTTLICAKIWPVVKVSAISYRSARISFFQCRRTVDPGGDIYTRHAMLAVATSSKESTIACPHIPTLKAKNNLVTILRYAISPAPVQRSVPLTHLVGLVTQPSALGDDFGHLVHLSLRTTECPEPLLREFSRTLVLAVTEQFNHAAFVWGETVIGKLSESRADVVRSGHGRRTQKLPSQRRERKQFSC
nr:hypothetical protein CFP56_25769 [Quercus suber]